MRKAIKAGLLSGLIFPGTGHISVGYKKTGFALIAIVLGVMAIVVTKVVEIAQKSLEVVQSKGGVVDMDEITKAATTATENANTELLGTMMFIIVAVWMFGIIDSIRIGRKLDQQETI